MRKTQTIHATVLALFLTGLAACGGGGSSSGSTGSSSTTTDTSTTTTTTDTTTTTTDTTSTGTSTGDSGAATTDTTAPTLVVKTGGGTTVESNGTEVATSTTFIATFSEAVDPTTVGNTAITITCGTPAQALTATTALATDTDGIADNEVTITPDVSLPAGETCVLSFSGVKDVAGNAMGTTALTITIAAASDGGSDGGDGGSDGGAPADTTAPAVSSVTTDSGATVATAGSIVTTAATFTVKFSEALSAASVTPSTVTLTCDGAAQTGTVAAAADSDDIADNEFTITPEAALPAGANCDLVFGTAIADTAGNALTEATYAFTTCGNSDDFSNADSLSVCWSARADNAGNVTAAVADGAATLTIDAAIGTADKKVGFTKTFTDDDLTATAVFTNLSGLALGGGQNQQADSATLSMVSTTDGGSEQIVVCGPVGSGGNGVQIMFFAGTPNQENPPATSDTFGSGNGFSGTLVVQLTKTGTDFTCEYSVDDGDFTAVGDTGTLDLGASYSAGISVNHTAGETGLSATLEQFDFGGSIE